MHDIVDSWVNPTRTFTKFACVSNENKAGCMLGLSTSVNSHALTDKGLVRRAWAVRAQNYLIHLSHFNKSKISLNRFNSQTNTKIGLTKTKTPGFESFDIKALKDCQERLIRLFPDSLQVTSRNVLISCSMITSINSSPLTC